jgi:hypothetical protein
MRLATTLPNANWYDACPAGVSVEVARSNLAMERKAAFSPRTFLYLWQKLLGISRLDARFVPTARSVLLVFDRVADAHSALVQTSLVIEHHEMIDRDFT